MNQIIKKSRTSEVLKGLLALILAVIIFVDPAEALMTIATYFGVLAIIVGIVLIIISARKENNIWQFLLFQGIVFTIIGALIVAYPGGTASLMIFFIGLLITFLGIIQLIAYLQMKDMVTAPQLSLVHAVLSLVIGGLLLFNPFEGAVLATLIMGGYATWYGITRLYMAWLMK